MTTFTDINGRQGVITFYPDRNPTVTVRTGGMPLRTYHVMRANLIGNGQVTPIRVGHHRFARDFTLSLRVIQNIRPRESFISFNYNPPATLLAYQGITSTLLYYERAPPPREWSNLVRHVRGYDAD